MRRNGMKADPTGFVRYWGGYLVASWVLRLSLDLHSVVWMAASRRMDLPRARTTVGQIRLEILTVQMLVPQYSWGPCSDRSMA